jgi:hypothetical protein
MSSIIHRFHKIERKKINMGEPFLLSKYFSHCLDNKERSPFALTSKGEHKRLYSRSKTKFQFILRKECIRMNDMVHSITLDSEFSGVDIFSWELILSIDLYRCLSLTSEYYIYIFCREIDAKICIISRSDEFA